MTLRVIRRLPDALIGMLLVALAFYLAESAISALRDPQFEANFMRSQEQSCVIRADVCEMVRWLRSRNADTVDVSTRLTEEVFQRIAEFGYPIRLQKNAPLRIDLCAGQQAGESIALQVRDVKRASEPGTDVCIFNRR